MKKIILYRKKELNNKGRKYKVFFNNVLIEEIRYDEDFKEINIPSLEGKLKVKIDWCSSNEIDLSSEECNRFLVRSTINDNAFLVIIFGIILFVGLYFFSKTLIFVIIPLILISYPLFLITFGKNNYLKLSKGQ